jgi:hypothetical protein
LYPFGLVEKTTIDCIFLAGGIIKLVYRFVTYGAYSKNSKDRKSFYLKSLNISGVCGIKDGPKEFQK